MPGGGAWHVHFEVWWSPGWHRGGTRTRETTGQRLSGSGISNVNAGIWSNLPLIYHYYYYYSVVTIKNELIVSASKGKRWLYLNTAGVTTKRWLACPEMTCQSSTRYSLKYFVLLLPALATTKRALSTEGWPHDNNAVHVGGSWL